MQTLTLQIMLIVLEKLVEVVQDPPLQMEPSVRGKATGDVRMPLLQMGGIVMEPVKEGVRARSYKTADIVKEKVAIRLNIVELGVVPRDVGFAQGYPDVLPAYGTAEVIGKAI